MHVLYTANQALPWEHGCGQRLMAEFIGEKRHMTIPFGKRSGVRSGLWGPLEVAFVPQQSDTTRAKAGMQKWWHRVAGGGRTCQASSL